MAECGLCGVVLYLLFIYLREAEREQGGGTEGEREKKILQQAPR